MESWDLIKYEASGNNPRVDAFAMDVVNGKIVETVRGAGTRTEGGVFMADHKHMCSGLKPSRGFGADAGRPENGHLQQQQSAGNFAPRERPSSAWATSFIVSDDTTTTSPLHAWDGAALRWGNRPVPEKGGHVHDFTGVQANHRKGWTKRSSSSGLWAMDVMNGKIVEPTRAARKTGDHGALGLKLSRARVAVDGGSRRPECIEGKSSDQLPGSFARAAAAEWTPSRACFSDEPMASVHSGASALSAVQAAPAVIPAPGWSTRLGKPRGHMFTGLQVPEVTDHRQGWKRSSRWGSTTDQRHYFFDSSPCSEGKLDEEMTMFESQMTRTVFGHFSNLKSVTSSLSQEISSHAKDQSAPVVADAHDAAEKKSTELLGTSSVLKRKRSGLPDGDVPGECGWIQPLKLLVRKGLTVSDVGELGRIIVPKKDAESQSFPQVGTKEGTVLEMEDYTASKRWYFRFKYWINNKSRMYVLENTGEFIKYHSLKEHDIFIVYEDGCKKLVVCGQKKSSNSLDPVLELSKGSIVVESSTSETPATTTTSTNTTTTIGEDERHLHQYR